MRLKPQQTGYVATKIGIDLANAPFIKMPKGREAVVEAAKTIIDANLAKEHALDEQVHKIIDENYDEIEFQLADERQLFFMIKKKMAADAGVIMNYDDRYNDLAHLILDELYENYLAEYTVNENQVKNVIFKAFKAFADAYDEIDDLVYAKIRDMEKEVVPGSQDYELLYERFYQEEISIDHSLSLSGQLFNSMPTRFSFGYTDQPGLRKTSSFERVSSKLSLSPTFFDEHLKVSINASLSSEANRFADGVEGSAIYMDPTQPIYDANSPFGGFFEYHTDGEPQNANRNPLASLLQRENISNVKRFYGNVKLDYKLHFFPDVSAVLNIGYDKTKGEGFNELSTESINGFRE